MKILKENLKKSSRDSLQTQISRFLFQYRLTPHTTTGVSPAELLLGRLIRPNLEQQVQNKQIYQKTKRGGRTGKGFMTGSPVLAKNFVSGQKWLSGTIIRSCGPRSYLIELADGREVRRHLDHIRDTSVNRS